MDDDYAVGREVVESAEVMPIFIPLERPSNCRIIAAKMKNMRVFGLLFVFLITLGLLFGSDVKIVFAASCTGKIHAACDLFPGCTWDVFNLKCVEVAATCSDYNDKGSLVCEAAGCVWDKGSCFTKAVVVPANCSTLPINVCQDGSHPNCMWDGDSCVDSSSTPCDNTGKTGLDLLSCYKLNATQSVGSVYKTPAVFVNLIVKIIFIISGIILFFMIIYSGFLFISGSTKGTEEAAKVMTNAVVGLIIVFSAFWIMQIIKLVTGADIGF